MSLYANFPTIRPSLLLDFANTQTLDPRITFTRSTTATYYDGVTTAKAEENLVLYSQEFDNAQWIKNRVTVSANSTTAPDGTTTADTLIEDTNTNSHYLIPNNGQTTFPLGTYTHSVYAKLASGTRRLSLNQTFGGVNGYAIFDLSGGTVAATSGSVTAAISDAGGGWYRCSVTCTTSTTTARFDIALNAGGAAGLESYTGDGTSGIYLWGAQLEQRSSVTAYTATTTQPITNYVPVLQTAAANVARFDHNPTTGESLGLLIEEQRTNLLQRSEEFDDAYWTKTNATVTANTAVAPGGTLTADKLVATAVSGRHVAFRNIATSASNAFTVSCYAKAGEYGFLALSVMQGSNSSGILYTFNLTDGTATQRAVGGYSGVSAQSQSVGNGWWRCSITFTNAGATADYVIIAPSPSATPSFDASYVTASYTGDGYSGIYIWGAQLEAGAFPTSYIATTSASVTRTADSASITGTNFSSWFNNSEGSLYADFKFNGLITFPDVFSIGSSSTNFMSISKNSGNLLRCEIVTNGGTEVNATSGSAVTVNADYKVSMAYAVNNVAVTLNAAAPTEDTGCTIPVATSATIGNRTGSSSDNINGTIKKIAYYPERLTNAQLQGLTS